MNDRTSPLSIIQLIRTVTRIPHPQFGLSEIKSCAEKTKFRNSTQISYKNLRGKDKIPQPPGRNKYIKPTVQVQIAYGKL